MCRLLLIYLYDSFYLPKFISRKRILFLVRRVYNHQRPYRVNTIVKNHSRPMSVEKTRTTIQRSRSVESGVSEERIFQNLTHHTPTSKIWVRSYQWRRIRQKQNLLRPPRFRYRKSSLWFSLLQRSDSRSASRSYSRKRIKIVQVPNQWAPLLPLHLQLSGAPIFSVTPIPRLS